MQTKESIHTEKDRIIDLKQRHLNAVKNRDLETLVDTFAHDGVEMSPNRPVIEGKEAYRAYCKAHMEYPGTYDFSFETKELEVLDNWAFERGSYTFTITDPAGKQNHDEGKYLWMYQKDGLNNWKLARVCYNSDLPIPK
ncbi:MAG: DUF4440 domain-containing protein [Marinifilaceae bacterium]